VSRIACLFKGLYFLYLTPRNTEGSFFHKSKFITMKRLLIFFLFSILFLTSCVRDFIAPYDTSETLTNSKSLNTGCRIEIGEPNATGEIVYRYVTIYAYYYKSHFKYFCYFDINGIKTEISEESNLGQSALQKCGKQEMNMGGVLSGDGSGVADTTCFNILGYKCWD
jgi:hypothetical protein